MPAEPAAFMSYVRFNDAHDDGQLTALRERLGNEVRVQTGEEFLIFQDRDISWGQNWQQRIDGVLDVVTLLLVIVTPSLFRSSACRAEIERFLEREHELGHQDLILPVYYVSALELDDPDLREADELARVLASRQYADWRELRFEPFTSPAVRKAIAQLAVRVRDILRQPPTGSEPADAGPRHPAGPQLRERVGRADFFISHAGSDRAWAEWVAWQLTEAGYTVELDVWDWAPGRNFVTAISDALASSDRVVALWSAEYFARSRYTTEEWASALLNVPGIGESRLVPLRVEDIPAAEVPGILRPLLFSDLFGLDAEQARKVLLDAVAGPRRPDRAPVFPGRGTPASSSRLGGSGPRLPGSVPRAWNIPARNPGLTGRDELLVTVRERLLSGDKAAVQALHGTSGVGKTQIAVEYAHRFAGAYDLAWWVDAEQPGLIGEQFAALASALGHPQAGADTEAARLTVLRELRDRSRWLLVFDNADDPHDLMRWLPGGSGHALITSRQSGWAEIAVPLEVDLFARGESIALLRDRVAGLTEADAGRLAAQLGDLPLALAQAAGYLAETGTTAGEYLRLVRDRASQILGRGTPASYPQSLAATIQLLADKLARDDPAAAQLANLCAFLAPEPVPESLFGAASAELAGELAARAADPLAWQETLAHLARPALARIDQRGLHMNRLTQAILRDRLTPAEAAAARERTEAILAANDPADPRNPGTWPSWARLMPHVLAADLAVTNNPGLRSMACHACGYLLARGETPAGYDLARTLRQHWRERLGEDDEHTLTATHYLARALRDMGRYSEARALNQDTLTRRRRLLGADHPDTLTSANSLAIDLARQGEYQPARELDEDTLARRRRVLGADHLDTLASANNLAVRLRDLGEYQPARELDEDTLARLRRVLGADHPATLTSASNLAIDLARQGEYQAGPGAG